MIEAMYFQHLAILVRKHQVPTPPIPPAAITQATPLAATVLMDTALEPQLEQQWHQSVLQLVPQHQDRSHRAKDRAMHLVLHNAHQLQTAAAAPLPTLVLFHRQHQ